MVRVSMAMMPFFAPLEASASRRLAILFCLPVASLSFQWTDGQSTLLLPAGLTVLRRRMCGSQQTTMPSTSLTRLASSKRPLVVVGSIVTLVL